ncbi:MAG TPA: FAD-dependent oxidoreductase [Pyrinomonadaceae bacterium]|nr:FAD-dependent oxidoreductase [Pyrinomonadaceae bacterium]
MAKVLILGGGFAGVIAAQRLARELSDEHEITLVSRDKKFIFYPALVRLAFGGCKTEDVSFDLRKTMLDRRVVFIEGEVARINPDERRVIIAHGEVEGNLVYDYLIYALGRRLATERISGFYEHTRHLMNVDHALRFGKAIDNFKGGHAVIGQCAEARMPVPVYETAFALSRLLEERGQQAASRVTIISPDAKQVHLGDPVVDDTLANKLQARGIEFTPDFSVDRVTANTLIAQNGQSIDFDLLMLVPPFRGSPAASHLGITNDLSYINVISTMRVAGVERMYAVGDCVNFSGPKMGHMAVRQGEVAAANVIAEINGREPAAHYTHEMKLVIDSGDRDSMYVHKDLWTDEPATVREGRFWSWAKRAQEKYWETVHS